MMHCPRCQTVATTQSAYCMRCGTALLGAPLYPPAPPSYPPAAPSYPPVPSYPPTAPYIHAPPPRPRKRRGTAVGLAFGLGWIGVHKFYLGRFVQGILYVALFWTFIPLIISFVEGIIYASQNDEQFAYIHSRR